MSEIDKKFSDFQEDECVALDQLSFVEKQICPTCIRDPNFVLESNWFDMTEGWLDRKTCEYKITVSREQINREDPESVDDQEIIRYGIRRLLAQFDKLIANETVCSFGGCKATRDEIKQFKGILKHIRIRLKNTVTLMERQHNLLQL